MCLLHSSHRTDAAMFPKQVVSGSVVTASGSKIPGDEIPRGPADRSVIETVNFGSLYV